MHYTMYNKLFTLNHSIYVKAYNLNVIKTIIYCIVMLILIGRTNRCKYQNHKTVHPIFTCLRSVRFLIF